MKWFEKIKHSFREAPKIEKEEKEQKQEKKDETVSKEIKEKEEKKKEGEKEIFSKVKGGSLEAKVKKETVGQYSHILLRPIISEKSTRLGAFGQYIFEVSPRANKFEIKKALEDVYGVKPISVSVSIRGGKSVRYGGIFGHRRSQKRAIVTLKKGDSLHLYEGV